MAGAVPPGVTTAELDDKSDNGWRFTPEEWWRIVSRATRNNGVSILASGKQFRGEARKSALDN
jgi:hypothetical protein